MGGEAPSVLGDLRKLAGAILDDPPDAASFIAHVTLGGGLPSDATVVRDGPIVRMNPVVRPIYVDGDWRWPEGLDGAAWTRLTTLELDTLKQADVELIVRLCELWVANGAPNQPIRCGALLTAEIGHDTYGGARAAAKKWLRA
jgi:hypothetical protein